MMSEKRIEEIAAEVASPASRYLPYWRTAVDFARAIEAECRVPEGYVLVPVEPSDSQLDVAVSFALNVRICSDYNWSAYMRDVYARMIAAAPKPDPERKHEIVPTIAAPVAQDPTAFLIEGFDGNGKRVAAVIQQNADNARNSASVFAEHYPSVKTSGLYLALQPDLTALREHDADVCQEFANFLGIEKREDVVKWIVAVRKGE